MVSTVSKPAASGSDDADNGKKKKIKKIVRNIVLNDETLSNVQTNQFGAGWHSFGLEHLIVKDDDGEVVYDQSADYELVLTALFGFGNFNPDNIGTFDADKTRVYPCNVYGKDDEVLVVFGTYSGKGTDNAIAATIDDDGDILIGKHDPKMVLITESVMVDGKATDVKVPYLSFEITTPGKDDNGNDAVIQVNFNVPFRVETIGTKHAESLQAAWLNGDIEAVIEHLKTPPSGGGGWMTLASITQTFQQAGLALPPGGLQFQIIDVILENGTYGEQIDAVLAPEWAVPLSVAKNGFTVRDGIKIRLERYFPGFASLRPFVDNAAMRKLMQTKGVFLHIKSFNGKDPMQYPNHSIGFGKAAPLVYPDFEKLLNIQSDQAALPGGNEFAQVPTAETVTVAATTVVDPIDSF